MAVVIEKSTSPMLGDDVGQIINSNSVKPVQWMVIFIALLLNILDGFDVTAMAFTAHSIGNDLSIPPQQLGLLFSTALAGMMLGAMFIAPLSDIIGRRKMILASVAVIGISMLATSVSSTLWLLIILRLATGLGVGGLLASLATITSEYTPEKYRSLTVVAVTAGYPLGASLGGFIAAPLLTSFGWQSVFVAGGLMTLAMLVLVYFWMPESLQFLSTRQPPGALQKINVILKQLSYKPLLQLPQTEVEAHADKATVVSLLTPERRLKTIQLWLTFFFCFISLYFLMSWVPKLVVDAGLSEAAGVYSAAVLNGGGVLGIVLLGWIATRVGLTALIGWFLIVASAAMVVYSQFSETLSLFVSLFVVGFLLQGGFCGLYAVAAKLYPADVRTTGVGWAIGLGRFGAVVGPYVGGFLIAAGLNLEGNFLIFAIPTCLAGVLALGLKVR